MEASEDTNYEKKSYLPASKSLSTHTQREVKTYKIIVIGDSSVGKTSLTFRFVGGEFPKGPEATIGVDFRDRTVVIEGEPIKLQLWDTAGQERFRQTMVGHFYRNVNAVVFVYDMTKMKSFENLKHWLNESITHLDSDNIPRILIGNKGDIKERIEVPTSVAQKFADHHNMPLFETSAKNDDEVSNIESIFLTIAHKVKDSRPTMSYNKRIKVISKAEYEESQNSSCCWS